MRVKFFTIRVTLILLLIFVGLGTVLEVIYQREWTQHVDVPGFKKQLLHQQLEADELVRKLTENPAFESTDLLLFFDKQKTNTAAFYYENNILQSWSTNEFSFQFPDLIHPDGWNYEKAANVHALFKWYALDDSSALLVLIPVKSAYPYENQYLQNSFYPPFGLSPSVQLYDELKPTNSSQVTDANNRLLFSIDTTINTDPPVLISLVGFCVFSFAFILLLILYFQLTIRNKKTPVKTYVIFTIAYTLLLLLLSWFDIPGVFYENNLFALHHFSVNQLLNSFTHLSVFTLFAVAALYSYACVFRRYKLKLTPYLVLLVYGFLLIELLLSMINHSGITFNFYLLNDLSFINIWAHVLLFFALAGGYFALSVAFPSVFNLRNYAVAGYAIIATLLTLGVSHHLNQNKKFTKYQILSENIQINGTSLQDPVAELLLEELAFNLQQDSKLTELAFHPDSSEFLVEYIENKHTFLFKNKFDISIALINSLLPETRDYLTMLQRTGIPIGSTGFYSLPSSLFESTYAGIIPLDIDTLTNGVAILFEFQNKRNFRSYSFPDLLINETSVPTQQFDISVASYKDNKLVYNDNRYEWPETNDFIQLSDNGFQKIKSKQGTFYIHQTDSRQVCITELQIASVTDKIFYFVLIITVFLVGGRVLISIHKRIHQPSKFAFNLTSKFQVVFISLLMISFLSTLFFSVNYFRKSYQKEQVQLIENKRHYIQASLQEIYFWVQDISAVDEDRLNNSLQEIAYRFQTDIHVYNLRGELAGSSLNLIFNKQLVSKLLSPAVMFNNSIAEIQQEQIGQLNYLSSYVELLNGDFLPIGYIAIPQYFSQHEINSKINQFLVAVIQIFTLIIILSIILVLVAGNRLATPLRLMEEKLKTMKLDGRNARIEYKGHDEIGQLVEQYNKTVDELEQSAYLLMKSERETAWRTMARQIAHEINNPLTPMKLTIQQLQRLKNQTPEQFDSYFPTATKTLIEQIDNLSRIAGTFSQFARLPETKMQTVDIADRLFNTVELFKNNAEGIEILYQGPQNGVLVKGDPEQFSRVFTNLVKNAVQAIPPEINGLITVQLTVEKEIQIKVIDNGYGIPKEAYEDIFKPNFTTKTSGMGLGLSISRAIIENAGGSIELESQLEYGTTFIVRLPQP